MGYRLPVVVHSSPAIGYPQQAVPDLDSFAKWAPPLRSHPHAIPSCHTPMPSPHAIPSCHPLMPHPHAILSCHTPMPSPHATPPCHPLMSHTHAIPSCHTPMPSSHATHPCHPLMSHTPHAHENLSNVLSWWPVTLNIYWCNVTWTSKNFLYTSSAPTWGDYESANLRPCVLASWRPCVLACNPQELVTCFSSSP